MTMLKIDVTKKYALAVSGGVDSMVMLHAFAHHLPRPNFFVVTVNHNIRKEGVSDCKFVANYCQNLGIECQIFDVDAPGHATENKLSLETSARTLRYQIFEKLSCDYLCLAHHQRDNVETVLMHILRGSGLAGAQGIKQYNGKYFRPLLNLSKEQIEKYAKDNDVPFVTDTTNYDDKYTRNYIRNKVLPLLVEICPGAEQNVARFAQNVAVDEEFLRSLADISAVQFDDANAKIPIELLKQPHPIAFRVIKKVFEQLGVYCDVESNHLQAICNVANNFGGKQTHLPFGYVAINDYNCVTICKTLEISLDEWLIPFAVGVTQTPLGMVEVCQQPSNDALRFDLCAIPTTAVFRQRQSGDIFTKFGGGTKPLKEYLIDKKIPQRERDQLLLVADGHNVLAIVGVEISDSIKTEPNSQVYYIKRT